MFSVLSLFFRFGEVVPSFRILDNETVVAFRPRCCILKTFLGRCGVVDCLTNKFLSLSAVDQTADFITTNKIKLIEIGMLLIHSDLYVQFVTCTIFRERKYGIV